MNPLCAQELTSRSKCWTSTASGWNCKSGALSTLYITTHSTRNPTNTVLTNRTFRIPLTRACARVCVCRDTAGQERFRTITTAYYRGAMVRSRTVERSRSIAGSPKGARSRRSSHFDRRERPPRDHFAWAARALTLEFWVSDRHSSFGVRFSWTTQASRWFSFISSALTFDRGTPKFISS